MRNAQLRPLQSKGRAIANEVEEVWAEVLGAPHEVLKSNRDKRSSTSLLLPRKGNLFLDILDMLMNRALDGGSGHICDASKRKTK